MSTPAEDANRSRRRSSAAAARRAASNRADTIVPDAVGEYVDDPEVGYPTAEPPGPAGPTSSDQASSANLSLLRRTRQTTSGQGLGMALPSGDLTRQLDSNDMIIPRLKISQAMSKANMLHAQSRGKEGVQMGNWYITTQNQDLGETVYFIPCDMRKSRSYFKAGQGLMCRSFDLLRGEGNPGILCEGTAEEIHTVSSDERGCVYRLWKDEGGKRIAPPCQLTYNYPGFMVNDAEAPGETELTQVMLQFRGTATGGAKSINTAFTTYGGGEWHRLIMELRIESRSNTKGIFFVPVVELYETADTPAWERVYKRAGMFARSVGVQDLRSSISTDDE